MPGSQSKKGEFRYRLYFWLMDACLFFGIIGLVDFINSRFNGDFPEGAEPGWYIALAIVTLFFSFMVGPFLILARFMRDEYAEQLWNRTCNALVIIVTTLPFVIVLSTWSVYLLTRSEEAPFPFDVLTMETQWWYVLTYVWQTFCLLFVAIYEFIRWQDSR